MPTPSPLTKLARSASTEEVIVSEHLADLRGRIRLLTWLSGLCWTSLVLFGGLLITGMLDWLVHFDDSGTRLVFGLALLGSAGWIFWRQLIAPLRQRLSSTFLAARVEHRYPGLKSRVVSAVEFLEHRLDSKMGSTELQKAVVAHAIDDLDRIESSDIVEAAALRNVTIAGFAVLTIAAIVTLLHPVEAATTVQRLAFPFSNVPWPRNVELQLVNSDLQPFSQAPEEPLKIASGDTLELYVQNKHGRLPERVWLEIRSEENAPISRESLRQTTLRAENGQAHESAVINWVANRGKMFFRVTGGDDNVMPFYRVEVVPAPKIESLQVKLSPPAYSRRPTELLAAGVGHVQGLLGTKVTVDVECDKPLQTAVLRIGAQDGIPLTIDNERHRFTAQFEITEALASTYWFELTDTEGFVDREAIHYEIRGIADGVPEVTIETPVTDVLLSPDAELPVTILAKDDLGLKSVLISYQIGDDEALLSIPLFATNPENIPAGAIVDNDTETTVGPKRIELSHLWKISELHLEPGTRIVFRGEAADTRDSSQLHVGKSIPRKITIVSGQEKQQELTARVGELLDDLQQATQLQQRARQQTQELQLQLEKVGELRPQDIDQLQRADLDQRQTASRLRQPVDGVDSQARQLLEEFRTNHLNDVGSEQRLERVLNELERLGREQLPDAEQALTMAEKLAEGISRQNLETRQGNAASDVSRPEERSVTKPNPKSGNPNHDERLESPQSKEQTKPAEVGGKTRQNTTKKEIESEKRQDETSRQKDSANPSQNSAQAQRDEENLSTPDPHQSMTTKDQSQEGAHPKNSKPPSNIAKRPEQAVAQPNSMTSDEVAAEASHEEAMEPRENPTHRSPAKAALEAALAAANTHQTGSLETLQELQDLLSEWRDRKDVSRDLTSVIDEQEAVQKDAAEMAQRTMTKSPAELTKQERAELNKLAARQRKVAEQLEKFRKSLEQTATSIQKNDPDVADQLNEAKQELNQQETASKLEDAAREIADNKMGSAAETQQKAVDELREVERMMKRQPNEDTAQFLKQTEDAQQEFQQIRQEQQNLADRVEDLSNQPDSQEKQEQLESAIQKQEELAERMSKAERKLERLRLRGPAEAANRARKRLTEMVKNAQESGDSEEMQEAMQEALDDLEQVERELVLEKRIAKERLAFEQLEKIEDELKALKSRQEGVLEETQRLDEAKAEKETLTRGQLKTLKELSETERSLQHLAEQMQQQMATAEIFSLVIKRLGRSLKLAADALSERETGPATRGLEQDAINKIDGLLAVLKQEPKKQEHSPPQEKKSEELANEPEENEEKPEEAQPPGDVIRQVAQLKLLKGLQEEYLKRTELLNAFRDKDGLLPESMEAEKNELAREQVELADFARNLVAKFLQEQPERKADEGAKEAEKNHESTKIAP